MKTLVLFIALAFSLKLHATTYYFSTGTGDDSRSSELAQNPSTPWKSLEKLNASFSKFSAGDIVAFKRGDEFYGSIVMNGAGGGSIPLVFSAYGEGLNPVITGLKMLQDFKLAKSNVYEAAIPSQLSAINLLLINGKQLAMGRYPNSNAGNNGFLYFESALSNTSITDSKLAGKNYNYGEIVIRKNRWVLDRNSITSHQDNTITYHSQSGYSADAGYGYFIQNHPATLDLDGEWYFDKKEMKIGIKASDGFASLQNVEVAVIDELVRLENVSNIRFENIRFEGSNKNAFYLKNVKQLQVIGCEFLFSGGHAITADNTTNISILNCRIEETNNIAFNGISCNSTSIINNKIRNTGTISGMGGGDAGSYEAIIISGDNNRIELNEIDSTGYIPLSFNGNNVIIKNNFISNYAFIKDDGGAIYTWNNSSNAPTFINRIIKGNIILNGKGAGMGTSTIQEGYANGIYIDDNASDVIIDSNTVANCNGNGIFIHNARNVVISRNTVYNNNIQFVMQHDEIAPKSKVVNNTVTGNIFFSLRENQAVAAFKTLENSLAGFGTFSNNFYCRPINEDGSIYILRKINGNYVAEQVDLKGWGLLSGKDAGSGISPKSIVPFTIKRFVGTNQFSNGNFDNNAGGLYAYSSANNITTTWASGALDGGSLKVSFNHVSPVAFKGTVILGIGSIKAQHSYVLKMSVRGIDNNKQMELYLRKSLAPYNDISVRKLINTSVTRKEVSLLFVPVETQTDASIGIDIAEQNTPVYIDNIQLTEVLATRTNPLDSVSFFYNNLQATKKFSLDNKFIDVYKKQFKSSIALGAFTSAILLKSSAAIVNTQSISCLATGTILREQWNNVTGNDVIGTGYGSKSDLSEQLPIFETQSNKGDNYSSRIRGYLCAPQSGSYIFWVAGDDAAQLFLSNDNNPLNKILRAYNNSWTMPREWNKYSSQKSVAVYMEAGKQYYVEVLHKQGGGGDHLAVGWQLPDGTTEMPIPGSRLSPYLVSTIPVRKAAEILNASTFKSNVAQLSIYPNPVKNFGAISFQTFEKNIEIDVIDLSGKIINRIHHTPVALKNRSSVLYNFSNFASGTYFLRITNAKNTFSLPFMVAK